MLRDCRKTTIAAIRSFYDAADLAALSSNCPNIDLLLQAIVDLRVEDCADLDADMVNRWRWFVQYAETIREKRNEI